MNETQPEVLKPPSRKVRWLLFLLSPKVAIPLMILLAILAAPFMYRSHQINKLPDIGDPFDVEAFGTVEITDEENAFVEYREASKLLVEFKGGLPIQDEYNQAMEGGWSAASKDIRNWVKINRPAMELWRKGTEKPDALYHQPKDVNISTDLDVIQNFRGFARLAQIQSSRLEEAGQMDEAWGWYRAMYRHSRHSGRHGTMIERLVGVAIQAMAANSIEEWSRNPQVTTGQLKQAIRQLKSDYRMTAPSSDALKVEYMVLQNSFSDGSIFDEVELPNSVRTAELYFLGEPELSRRVMQHVWENQLAHIDKSLHQRPKRTSHMYDMLFESSSESSRESHLATLEEIEAANECSYLARLILPPTYQFEEAILREQLRHRALLVVLAAQWYQREHGKFPEKVDDILDGYLDEILLDPHDAKGGKIQYRRNVDGFIVWGIGPNGIDDGGIIDPDDPEKGDIGFHVGKDEINKEKQ